MICQKCGMKNATSHIHSVVNGVVQDAYLCAKCAAEYQTAAGDNSLFKMLSSFLNDGVPSPESSVKCECCGATFDEISRTGRAGCGNCYKTFRNELAPTLIRIHGRTTHLGKRPAVAEPVQEPVSKIDELKAQLAEAVANEEYEKAAVIRDEIKRIGEGK